MAAIEPVTLETNITQCLQNKQWYLFSQYQAGRPRDSQAILGRTGVLTYCIHSMHQKVVQCWKWSARKRVNLWLETTDKARKAGRPTRLPLKGVEENPFIIFGIVFTHVMNEVNNTLVTWELPSLATGKKLLNFFLKHALSNYFYKTIMTFKKNMPLNTGF